MKKGWPSIGGDSVRVGEANIPERKSSFYHCTPNLFDEPEYESLPCNWECFNFICREFPALTIEKLKAGIMMAITSADS